MRDLSGSYSTVHDRHQRTVLRSQRLDCLSLTTSASLSEQAVVVRILQAGATGPAAERRLNSFASALQYLECIIDRMAGDDPNPSAAAGGRTGRGGGAKAAGDRTTAAGGTGRVWWPRNRIHLFGFSQGGTAALHMAALSTCAPVPLSLRAERT